MLKFENKTYFSVITIYSIAYNKRPGVMNALFYNLQHYVCKVVYCVVVFFDIIDIIKID